LLQINESKVRSWIQHIEEEKWRSKVLSSSTQEAFWLLWNLYQADEQIGKSVTHFIANDVLSNLTTEEAKNFPLLGFFVFCNIKFDLNIPIPTPYKIPEKISEDLSMTELAFSIYFLKKKNDRLLKEFSKELGRYLFLRNHTFPIKKLIENHPFENVRQLFMKIFEDFDISSEPDSTFLEMIYMTQTYLDEKKKTQVAFGQLRDFFLNNPINSPIFKSLEDSNKWLTMAIKEGIYNVEEVPHHRNPSWKVNLLSLNKDVVFQLFEKDEM
jgi:hypothetical protein